MCEGTVTGDVVIKRNRDVYCSDNYVFKIPKFLEIVFAFDVFFVGSIHASEKTTNGSDSVSLSDTKDGGIDVGSTCFEGTVGVCDGTAGIIVEMTFDIARDDTSKSSDEIVYLSWVCTSNLLVRFHVTWRDDTVSAIPTRLTPTLSTVR